MVYSGTPLILLAPKKCPDQQGVLISGVEMYMTVVFGTAINSCLYQGVFISECPDGGVPL